MAPSDHDSAPPDPQQEEPAPRGELDHALVTLPGAEGTLPPDDSDLAELEDSAGQTRVDAPAEDPLDTWARILVDQGQSPGKTYRSWPESHDPAPGARSSLGATRGRDDAGALPPSGEGATLVPGSDARWQWAEEDSRAQTRDGGAASGVFGELAAGEAYQLQSELGRGGMGIVHRAYQPSLDREVAVKRLIPEVATPHSRLRFVAEAQMTAGLSHPNVVAVHGLSRAPDGQLLLPMALVRGASWRELLEGDAEGTGTGSGSESEKLSFEDHLRIFSTVCNTVAFAHTRGVLHLDLKPANVMVGEYGEVLLSDWGLAMYFGELQRERLGRHVSELRSPCGTPSYMAPELARGAGAELGPWTDVYLLGGILCELIRGTPPHTGESTRDVIGTAIAAEPPDLSGGRGSSELKAICTRALSKAPGERYPSVEALLAELRSERGHRESVTLAEAAHRRLAAISPSGAPAERYRGYDEALAGFRQAQTLWPENRLAGAGEVTTRLAYTRAALDAGDLQLAEGQLRGLLAERPPAGEAVELEAALQAALAARRARAAQAGRLRSALIGSVGLLVAVLALGFGLVSAARGRALAAKLESDRQRDLALEARSAAEARREEAQAAQARALDALAQTFEQQARGASARGNWGESALYALEALETRASPARRARALQGLAQSWETTVYPLPAAALTDVTWGPKEERLAAACGQSVFVFARDGRLVHTLEGHSGGAVSVSWSSSGSSRDELLAVGHGAAVKLWDAGSGAPRGTLALGGAVSEVLWSPEGDSLAVVSAEGFGVWSPSGELRWRLAQPALHVQWLGSALQAVTPSGELLTVGPGGEVVQRVGGTEGRDYGVARASPDGGALLAAQGGSLELWVDSRLEAEHGSFRTLASLAWAPNMARAAGGGSNGSVLLIEPGGERTSFLGHQRAVRALAFDAAGARLASGDDAGQVRVWDTSLREPSASFSLPGAVRVLEFSRGGVLVGTEGGHLRRFQPPATRTFTRLLDTYSEGIERVAFSRQDVLASIGRRSVAGYTGVPVGRHQLSFFDSAQPTGPSAWSPAGSLLAVAFGGQLALWDGKESREDGLASLTLPHAPLALAWGPDERQLALLSEELLAVLDPASGKVMSARLLETRPQAPALLAFAPDGTSLVFKHGSELVLHELATGAERVLSTRATCLAWRAERLVWGEAGGAVYAADVPDAADKSPPAPELLIRLPGSVQALELESDGRAVAGSDRGALWVQGHPARAAHAGPVLALAFGRAGVLASGGADGIVSIWRGPEEVLRFEHPGPVKSLAWDRARETLASACSDGVARAWRLADLTPSPRELGDAIRRRTRAHVVGGAIELLPAESR